MATINLIDIKQLRREFLMKKTTVGFIICVTIAGCANNTTYYKHLTKSNYDFTRDERTCEIEASKLYPFYPTETHTGSYVTNCSSTANSANCRTSPEVNQNPLGGLITVLTIKKQQAATRECLYSRGWRLASNNDRNQSETINSTYTSQSQITDATVSDYDKQVYAEEYPNIKKQPFNLTGWRNRQVTDNKLSFPMHKAFNVLVANGVNYNFTFSGTSSGFGNITITPANTKTTFEGREGYSSIETLTMTPLGKSATRGSITNFFDSNHSGLGFDKPGESYGVWEAPPNYPSFVKTGENGTLGTINLYADSTKSTSKGRYEKNYTVSPDTEFTAIIKIVTHTYDNSNTLEFVQEEIWRTDSHGALSPIYFRFYGSNANMVNIVLEF